MKQSSLKSFTNTLPLLTNEAFHGSDLPETSPVVGAAASCVNQCTPTGTHLPAQESGRPCREKSHRAAVPSLISSVQCHDLVTMASVSVCVPFVSKAPRVPTPALSKQHQDAN